MLIKIKKDLFNICKRIKNIDNGYALFFNTRTKKYEVHNFNQLHGSYCSTLPFNKLDSRAIDYLLETQNKNAKKLFEMIEKNNNKLKNEENAKLKDESDYKFGEIYNYANNNSKTFNASFSSNLWF